MANTLADVFVQNNIERQEMGTSKAAVALAQEIAKYQGEVKKKRDARFNYARDHSLPLTPTATLTLSGRAAA